MATIDVFSNNAFDMASLTEAAIIAPYKPRLLGSLGIFKEKPIRTTTAYIERKNGRLAILNTAARGTIKDVRATVPRSVYPVKVPHVPYFQPILADDIQNIRAFGSETELEAVSAHVNEQLIGMRDDHEVTHEFHRVGALKGVVLDGDNTTEIVDFYDLFDIVQTEVDWFSSDDSFQPTATAVIRAISGALGQTPFGQIFSLCGDEYFDAVVTHTSVRDAYKRWLDGEFLRVSHLGPEWYSMAVNGFMYQGIMFINYRGEIGDVNFIAEDEAYYFPSGVPGMFQEAMAPADFMETVNTLGKKLYAKQERMDFDKGVTLHTQSNVLTINTRPEAVVKSTWAAEEGS